MSSIRRRCTLSVIYQFSWACLHSSQESVWCEELRRSHAADQDLFCAVQLVCFSSDQTDMPGDCYICIHYSFFPQNRINAQHKVLIDESLQLVMLSCVSVWCYAKRCVTAPMPRVRLLHDDTA